MTTSTTTSTAPQHGDQRNVRHETTVSTGVAHTAMLDGQPQRVMLGWTMTQSVSERFCGWCNTWVKVKGLIGGMLCPVCAHCWDEAPPAENGG